MVAAWGDTLVGFSLGRGTVGIFPGIGLVNFQLIGIPMGSTTVHQIALALFDF